jgi:hypothetical protein
LIQSTQLLPRAAVSPQQATVRHRVRQRRLQRWRTQGPVRHRLRQRPRRAQGSVRRRLRSRGQRRQGRLRGRVRHRLPVRGQRLPTPATRFAEPGVHSTNLSSCPKKFFSEELALFLESWTKRIETKKLESENWKLNLLKPKTLPQIIVH